MHVKGIEWWWTSKPKWLVDFHIERLADEYVTMIVMVNIECGDDGWKMGYLSIACMTRERPKMIESNARAHTLIRSLAYGIDLHLSKFNNWISSRVVNSFGYYWNWWWYWIKFYHSCTSQLYLLHSFYGSLCAILQSNSSIVWFVVNFLRLLLSLSLSVPYCVYLCVRAGGCHCIICQYSLDFIHSHKEKALSHTWRPTKHRLDFHRLCCNFFYSFLSLSHLFYFILFLFTIFHSICAIHIDGCRCAYRAMINTTVFTHSPAVPIRCHSISNCEIDGRIINIKANKQVMGELNQWNWKRLIVKLL